MTDYILERELGRGGMATVLLARDRKHDRQVAIKVLHPELAAMVGSERFLREIRVIATLQHPHIVGLIDSGVFGPDDGELAGRPYYVMPYIAGESLRQRLEREGQLPIGEAVRIAREVAAALEHAHRRGVVHRDVKPENILLSDDSTLVTDFGIALAVEQAGGERMTQTGLSLGTPRYMSPEQAMGERTVSPRTDVYALGVVTYEMLAGEPPFDGPTAQAIVARVLSESPRSLRIVRPNLPPHIETAVLQAIERLPADRFATTAAFAAALGAAPAAPQRDHGDLPRRRAAASLLPWGVAAVSAAVAVAALLGTDRGDASAPPPVYRFEVDLPSNAEYVGDILSTIAVSPDGKLIVYNGRDSTGGRRLYLRAMDRLDPAPVAGSENAAGPFFSPDGAWVGFLIGTRIVRVPVSGGPPQLVCDAGGLVRAAWLEQDLIVFADAGGLRQCRLDGGPSILLARPADVQIGSPHPLPGDRALLLPMRRADTIRLMAVSLPSLAVKDLGIAGTDPRYVETGHLVYLGSNGLLHVVGFDAAELAVTGEPAVLDEPVPISYGRALMGVSREGTIVTAWETAERSLELVDRTGRAERLHGRTGSFGDPRLSPDGRRIALGRNGTLWVLDRAQGTLARVTPDSGITRPVWSPDGRRIAYMLQSGARMHVRLVSADGAAPPETVPIRTDGIDPWEVLFTRDGGSVLARTAGGTGSRDVWLVPLDTSVPSRPLLNTAADEVAPDLSPDGRWLAYVSNESGRAEVFVREFPSMSGRYQVSLEGGTEPGWASNGELLYRSGSAFVSAQVRTEPSFDVVRRVALFREPEYDADLTHRVFDVTPDGERLVAVRRLGGTSHLKITLNRFRNLGDQP